LCALGFEDGDLISPDRLGTILRNLKELVFPQELVPLRYEYAHKLKRELPACCKVRQNRQFCGSSDETPFFGVVFSYYETQAFAKTDSGQAQ
jgi:hypothetical protein